MSTAINFTFSGGSYQSDGYTPIVDDGYGASGSNGVWRWDISHQNTRYDPGSSYWLQYTQSTGEWIAVGGSANDVVGTRNGNVITCGTFAVFDETTAFQGGVVPTSSLGTLSTSTVKTLTQSGTSLVAFVGGGNASVSNLSIIDVNGSVPSNPGVSVWHTHTNGTDTTFSWPISEPGEYRLMNLQSQYAIITVTSISKKVFCNFW